MAIFNMRRLSLFFFIVNSLTISEALAVEVRPFVVISEPSVLATKITSASLHILPPHNDDGSPKPRGKTLVRGTDGLFKPLQPQTGPEALSATPNAKSTTVTPTYWYPTDVSKSTGAVVKGAKQHLLYVNCTQANGGCWGNPSLFVADLSNSTMIHVTDQYVGSTGNNRYPVGKIGSTSPTPATTIYDADALTMIHDFAVANGLTTNSSSTITNMFHIFLPSGVNECIDSSKTDCYAPTDAGGTWTFCAYHGAATFSDIGTIVYSVEPYQNVAGCRVTLSTNGQVVDATASTLSHEIVEAITDPLPPTGWTIQRGYFQGNEVADICVWVWATTLIGSKNYTTQLEYSNLNHRCGNMP